MTNTAAAEAVDVADGERVEALMTAAEVVIRLEREGWGRWEAGTLREWMREGVPLPVAERGKPGREHLFSFSAVVRWLREREARREARLDPLARKQLAEARLAELRADELEARSIPAAEVEAAWGYLVDAARTTVRGWRVRLVPQLVGLDENGIRAVLERECDDLLRRLQRAETSPAETEAPA